MLSVLKTRQNPRADVVMNTIFRRLKQTPSVNNGVLSSKSSYEDYDFVQAVKNFKSSDFTIDNILQVGSYDMLKPSFVSTMSDMDFVDKFQDIKFVDEPNN